MTQTVWTVLNDSTTMDHPSIAVFNNRADAMAFIKELFEYYLEASELPPDILPEPIDYWDGVRYDFDHPDGYCSEWAYLSDSEVRE